MAFFFFWKKWPWSLPVHMGIRRELVSELLGAMGVLVIWSWWEGWLWMDVTRCTRWAEGAKGCWRGRQAWCVFLCGSTHPGPESFLFPLVLKAEITCIQTRNPSWAPLLGTTSSIVLEQIGVFTTGFKAGLNIWVLFNSDCKPSHRRGDRRSEKSSCSSNHTHMNRLKKQT